MTVPGYDFNKCCVNSVVNASLWVHIKKKRDFLNLWLIKLGPLLFSDQNSRGALAQIQAGEELQPGGCPAVHGDHGAV